MNKSDVISVLHIASGDLWAGAEVQLFTLAKALNNIPEVNIHIILLNHGALEQKLINYNIKVTVIDESKLNSIKILYRLINTVRQIKPDIVHTHRVKENTLGSIASLFNHTPSLRTSHGAPEYKPALYSIAKRSTLAIDWFCGRFLQKKIIAVSTDLSEILQRDFPSRMIETIENGIDLQTIVPSTMESNNQNTALRDSQSTFRVGIACRLVTVKRVDIFIKAAASLIEMHAGHNISFHIYGDGPLEPELVALNKSLNTESIVYFEGHCDDMQQQLSALDALLITSDHEGLPMILLEAMALKVPIISHSVGGIPEVLNQGTCGYLISDHQPKVYADAIYQLSKDVEMQNNYITNAFSRVTKNYSSQNNANKYLAIYKEIR